MGRKTLESLPGGRVLEGRTNIVLTRNKNYKCKGAVICHSVEAVLEEIKKYRSEDVYIIGGESVYQAFMPYADRIHLTRIDYVYEADTFFPEISPDEWSLMWPGKWSRRAMNRHILILFMIFAVMKENKNKTAYMMTMPARNSSGKVS